MGGCRCTYRNCTVKTDGKTHLFHYPVFEKVRCHKWLVNAHRLDFLDLKVSQLKNRVICQHHFQDDNFMNYKKDKLTFEAIPTEDGPFCDSSNYKDPSQDIAETYPNMIILEDIENEVIFDNKKANFSLKYGDFLTNGELMKSSLNRVSNNINLSEENSKLNFDSNAYLNLRKESPKPQIQKPKPCYNTYLEPAKTVQKPQSQPSKLAVPPYTEMIYEIGTAKEPIQEVGIIKLAKSNMTVCYPKSNCNLLKVDNRPYEVEIVKKEPKIKILSEEKIEGPIPVIGKLEKVSPTATINILDKKRETIGVNNNVVKDPPNNDMIVVDVLNVEFDQPNIQSDKSKVPETNNKSTNNNNLLPKRQKGDMKTKSKLSPERTAAIQQKRKFNMKMKDILETCLDKLDEPVVTKEKITLPRKTRSKSLIKQPDLQVSSYLSKEETLPNVQEYTIAYLDERMKSMEKVLLNKIEQNSQKIVELTETCGNKKKNKESPKQKKNVSVQTNESEEQYKRFLYQELCKYISQDSKSLIYEELFINQFALTDSNLQRKKRRKYI